MRYLLFHIAFFIFFGVWSQSNHPSIPFEHVSIPGTINSSQVIDLIQDHHGLIWVAGDGLYKYDGYKFTTYKQLSPTKSIAGKEINILFDNKDSNTLLLGTHSYGIIEYDYDTDVLKEIPSEGGTPIISCITQTADKTIWAGSFSNGLYYLEKDTLQKLSDPKNIFGNSASLLAIGNKLLVDKLRTIYVLEEKKVVDSIQVEFPGYDFPSTTRITSMTVDGEGHIWMGTERSGVLVYDTLENKFIKHFAPDHVPFYNRINRIMVDSKKNVWILTKSNGVVVYTPSTDSFIHITKNPSNERSLTGDNCTSIFEDKSGIIWIGATGDLNKYDPTKIKFRHIYNNPMSPIALNDNMVRAVYEARDGKLWVGTDGGVIHIFNQKKISVEKISINLKGNTQHIVPLYFLELNNLMLIGTPIGLLQFDYQKKLFQYYNPLEEVTKNRQTRQMIRHGDELVLSHGGALQIYNLKSGRMQRFSEFGIGNRSAKNVTAVHSDSQGRLWVGVSNGISLYDPSTESFRHFPFEENPARPLGTYFMVLSIQEYQNKLWVGTFNSGLWSMDLSNLQDPKIINITEKKGLPSNTVYSTIPDNQGNLWMSTNQGITKYEIKKNAFTNFGPGDGLQQEEFNRLAFTACSNGELVFGGINGLTIFHPKNIKLQEEIYKPIVLGVSVFNEKENKGQFTGLVDQSTLLLEHDQNDLEFQFFVPNYRTPRRFETYYMLTSYDPTWVTAESNTIRYSNLKPGSYTLTLKTISGSGIEQLTSYNFNIRYPFWQTWWFILLTASITGFLVFTIIQNNLQKTKHDKERLEKLLNLRTKEIEKSREELANLNEKKDLIFSILSHDLRSPLTTLKGFLSILIDDQDHLSKEDIKKHASSIRNSVTSSLDLIDNTLFWSLSQTGNITYTPTAFSLDEMLTKIGNLYQLTADKKRIQLLVDVHEKVMIQADENMVYVALRNLVSNAIKFTSQGKVVKITTVRNHHFAEIKIMDEGIGMSQTYLEKLLSEEQLPLKKGTSNEKGTGLGLILCKKFIQLNKGQLEVHSVEDQGTEFIVKLPLA